MSKENQKRIIEINHAFSGIFGEDVKTTAFKINDARKEALKKLERKKKLAPVIHDQLYSYLEKFPQEKLGLNQEFVKKKKAKLTQFEERFPYKCPTFSQESGSFLASSPRQDLVTFGHFFQFKIEIEQSSESDSYKN